MQIYSKSMKNATSPLFRNHNRSALQAGTYITHRVIYYPLVVVVSARSSFFILSLPAEVDPGLFMLGVGWGGGGGAPSF